MRWDGVHHTSIRLNLLVREFGFFHIFDWCHNGTIYTEDEVDMDSVLLYSWGDFQTMVKQKVYNTQH